MTLALNAGERVTVLVPAVIERLARFAFALVIDAPVGAAQLKRTIVAVAMHMKRRLFFNFFGLLVNGFKNNTTPKAEPQLRKRVIFG